MEEMACLWDYQEGILELKHKLLCTTFELESARIEAEEEMRKNDGNIKQLLQLLQMACQERDEAKDQLQRLLNDISPSIPTGISPVLPQKQDQSLAPRATELDSIANGSSPAVDCFFNGNSSSDLSNTSLVDSGNFGVENSRFVQDYRTMIDPALAAIDTLTEGRALPQKGELLQAVIEAGPLLETLLVAGPIPQWHNPPPKQSLLFPSFSIHRGSLDQKKGASSNCKILNSLCSSSYHNLSHRSSPLMSNSARGSGLLLNKEHPLPNLNSCDPGLNEVNGGKQERLH